jgi:thioredoxin-related protein
MLKQKYATPFQGFPTTVILDSNGKKLGEKVGYPPGSGPQAFLKEIGQIAKK